MHIVLVYRYYNDGIVYYNLTFCTRKSLMTDLGLRNLGKTKTLTLYKVEQSYVLFHLFSYNNNTKGVQ